VNKESSRISKKVSERGGRKMNNDVNCGTKRERKIFSAKRITALKIKFWGYTKNDEGQRCNKWRIGRSDNAGCNFPADERIKELASQVLGAAFIGIEYHSENCLLLQVVPKTDRKKITELAEVLGLETK